MRAVLLPIAVLGIAFGAMGLGRSGSAQAPNRPIQIALGPNSGSYVLQVAGDERIEEVTIRVAPEVRRAAIRFNTLPPLRTTENRLLAVELFRTNAEGAIIQREATGKLIQVRDLERIPDVYRVLWLLPPLEFDRKGDVYWLLRFHSLPLAPDRDPLPVQLGIEIHSDATPLTERERSLIAWREGIKDPVRQVDLVRAKVAELTEDEVRLYTAFDSRELFLKYWMRTRKADIVDANNRIALAHRAGYRGLTSTGKPLPNGKYLHHNGTVPPLPD